MHICIYIHTYICTYGYVHNYICTFEHLLSTNLVLLLSYHFFLGSDAKKLLPYKMIVMSRTGFIAVSGNNLSSWPRSGLDNFLAWVAGSPTLKVV